MARNRLLRLLDTQGVAVCDGAMGTMLYARGVFINRSFEELNLSRPELVQSVHAAYVAAGADVIETNTFGANRYKLAAHGLEGRVGEVNLAGARLARLAAGAQTRIAGAIGPLGIRMEPWGPTSAGEVRDAFREQAAALLEGGVELIILETFHHLPELREAVLAVRSLGEVPLVAQVTVTEERATPEGVSAAEVARTVGAWDVDCVGVNCGVGPLAALEALEEMHAVTDLPLSVQPNAGLPRNVHGRNMYLTSPEFLASYARRYVQAGARLVGGCCGTTPEHVRAVKAALLACRPAAAVRPAGAGRPLPAPLSAEAAPAAARPSELERRLREGGGVVMVQVPAPRGCDPLPALASLRALGAHGAGWVLIPESGGGGRMPPLAFAQLVQQHTDLEALPEYACRRRTLLGMQSEMLGAQALGLRDVLLVTGAPGVLGEHPDATAGLDVDAIGLTHMVRRLNEGLDIAGNALEGRTSLFMGVRLDPEAVDPEHELRRFEWKIDAGARFACTPPLADAAALRAFLPRIAHCRVPIIAALRPAAATQAGLAERDDGVKDAVRLGRELQELVEGICLVPPETRPAAPAGAEWALRVLDGLAESTAGVSP